VRQAALAGAVGLVLLGAAGCGPSAEQVREAQAEAAQAQIDTERAQTDARKAQIAAQQAQIASDQAQKVVSEDVKEINRACDHIDQILKERAAKQESDN